VTIHTSHEKEREKAEHFYSLEFKKKNEYE
jgi:hypothetical protein